jgi:hypothetical protein
VNEDSVNILYSEFKYGNDNATVGESSAKNNSQIMFLESSRPRRSIIILDFYLP